MRQRKNTILHTAPRIDTYQHRLPDTPNPALIDSMTQRILILLTLVAVTMWCPGAGQKHKTYVATFHVEAAENFNPKMVTPLKLGSQHKQYFFSKLPTFTDHDIAWFYPFTAQDGITYGVAFRFKEHAAVELKAITLTNQGKLLGIKCSDAPIHAVLIDRPIDDGVVVIWEGLQQRHLQEFRKRFPHVDDLAPASGPEFALPGR